MARGFDEKKWMLENAVMKGGYNQREVPSLYQESMDSMPERIEEIRECVSLLPEKFESDSGDLVDLSESTVVDLGSGPGLVTREIKDKVGHVIAIDRAPEMVSFLKKQFAEAKNVQAVAGDMVKTPLKNQSVEAIISAGTIFELHDEKAEDDFLKEAMRVLKANGVLIMDGISDSSSPRVERNFSNDYRRGLQNVKKHVGLAPTQRYNVFRDDQLEAKLKQLGFKTRVEPFFNGVADYCAVRITKLTKENEI